MYTENFFLSFFSFFEIEIPIKLNIIIINIIIEFKTRVLFQLREKYHPLS